MTAAAETDAQGVPHAAPPPHNLEAEEAVLGSCLDSRAAAATALGILGPGDFYRTAHRLIFEAMAALHGRGDPVDVPTVKDELGRQGTLDEAGGGLYLANLLETLASPASIAHHARIVLDKAEARHAIALLSKADRRIRGGAKLAEVLPDLAALYEQVGATSAGAGSERWKTSDLIRAMAEPMDWLIEGLWPGDAYGVLGAEFKAGKTWAGLDLAVSVATGTLWLDRFQCSSGPVLLYLGEGGKRLTGRRLDAIARSRGLTLGDLEEKLTYVFRPPKLTTADGLRRIVADVEATSPTLVELDPLYLSVGGAKGSDLYGMGEVLGGLQEVCQDAASALVVTTHWNKGGTGGGADRFTGVGPQEWGRVLGSAEVKSNRTEEDTSGPGEASIVMLKWKFRGSEIADEAFSMVRRVYSSDRTSLTVPLEYGVEVVGDTAEPADGLSPSERRVLAILRAGGEHQTVPQIQEATAHDGSPVGPLQTRTVQAALPSLESRGLAAGTEAVRGSSRYWSVVPQ